MNFCHCEFAASLARCATITSLTDYSALIILLLLNDIHVVASPSSLPHRRCIFTNMEKLFSFDSFNDNDIERVLCVCSMQLPMWLNRDTICLCIIFQALDRSILHFYCFHCRDGEKNSRKKCLNCYLPVYLLPFTIFSPTAAAARTSKNHFFQQPLGSCKKGKQRV